MITWKRENTGSKQVCAAIYKASNLNYTHAAGIDEIQTAQK